MTDKTRLEKLYEAFREEILTVFLDPDKGLEYLEQKLGIERESIYEAIAPNSFNLFIKGDIKDKDRIVAFKKLFTKTSGKSELFHELLDAIAPESMKAYKREIDILRDEKGKSWLDIQKTVGLDYRRLHNYYIGLFYPSIKNLKKLSSIISIETVQAIASEVHGEQIKVDAIKNPNQDVNDLLIRANEIEEDDRLFLINGLINGMSQDSLLAIAKNAIDASIN